MRDHGGQLVVSPNANVDVIRASKQLGLASVPGVMTPTEAFAAMEAGADALKLFPAAALGPSYVKDIKVKKSSYIPDIGSVISPNMSMSNMFMFAVSGRPEHQLRICSRGSRAGSNTYCGGRH